MKKYLYMLIVGFSFLALSSCGGGGNSASPDTPDTSLFTLPTGKTAFYNPGIDITPFISPTVSESLALQSISTKGWDWRNPLNYAFDTLRQYNHETDDGVVDISNMYKLLFEAGNVYATIAENIDLDPAGTSLGANGKIVLPPFDLGTPPTVYTHAFTRVDDNGYMQSGALAKNGETYNALLTFVVDESDDPTYPGKKSYGVIEGSFGDLETGDLELNLAYMVDYNNGVIYSVRTYVTGNAGTHNFNLVAATGNQLTEDTIGVCGLSSAGVSFSEDDGNDDYFLLQFNGKNVDDKYFRISALSPSETDLMSYLETGYDIDEISDPANYAAELSALEFFTISDIPMRLSDFTNSSVILDY